MGARRSADPVDEAVSAEEFLEQRLAAETDMASVAGMASANRRLARLGVQEVDLSVCDHGCNAEAAIVIGSRRHTIKVHGQRDWVAAVDALADVADHLRMKNRVK